MKYIGKFLWTISITVTFISCNTDGESLFDQVVGSKKGHFRGHSIGANIEEVKKGEKEEPKDWEEDYLYYDIELNEYETYTLSYSFDEKGLYEIQIDVYLDKIETASELFKTFKTHFTKKYGISEEEDLRYGLWVLKSEMSDEIEITLVDESLDYDYAKVSISFYDYDY